MKIHAYLALMVSAILLPVIIFSLFAVNTLLQAEREAVLRGARETVRASALRVDKELSNAEVMLRVLSTSHYLAIQSWSGFYKQAKVVNQNADTWIVLFNENGQQLVNTMLPFGARLPAAVAKQRIQQVLQSGKPQVSHLFVGSVTRENIVAIDFPITLKNGKRYVINQTFLATYFSHLLSSPEITANTILGIYDRNGITIARNLRPAMFVGKPPKDDLRQAILKQRTEMIRNVSRDGKDTYTLFAHSSMSGWTCTLGMPANDVDAAARHAIRLTAIGLLTVLLCVVIAAFLFGKRLIHSIANAADSAAALGKGAIPAAMSSGIEELDRLQLTLNAAGITLRNVESERAKLLIGEKIARNHAEQQNTAKDQFLAMLGHELRNPLAPISAAAELLKIAPLAETRVRQTSEIITRQVHHLTGLVDDLLDVSRVTRGLITLDKHTLNMKQVVIDAEEQVRPLVAARRHHFALHMPAESVFIFGDQKRLIQVMSNLFNNAAKYTPEGGDIVVTMEIQNEHVMLAVADNGIGMAPELVARAFDLFAQGERTSDRAQGGLGVGLALVKSLVELHGGSITAQSKGSGTGSEFTIFLPRAAPLLASPPTREEPVSVSTRGLRLLIVDDNADAAKMLAMFLEALGYEVMVEHGSKRALERARIEMPDVYLLDIGLPDMDGIELARRLRAQSQTAAAILIAITGYGQPQDRNSAMAAGFDYYFVKPVDTEQLATLLAGFTGVGEQILS